ncbi:hypothetical protein [Paraburkholderia acidiphila]|uniref:Uncharacterized protein n=1 Tax=Paraburkholderia acidiphila TaxID=2571747 RepID=A0A7Z2GCW2_9BURK|nr:hypothetical protein [Paraburkholderia acidiphila]QGZ59402.1 hypothetical protein FAZ97_30850 [Paraburkholderia acidiphila]
MFRTIVEQTSRVSAAFPLSPALRAVLRGSAILFAAVMALLLALLLAPSSTRANFALCIASQSELPATHNKADSLTATSLAILQCIN